MSLRLRKKNKWEDKINGQQLHDINLLLTFIINVNTQKTSNPLMKKQRIIGQIRQTPISTSPPPPSTLPHSITDLTINNINLYKEMK